MPSPAVGTVTGAVWPSRELLISACPRLAQRVARGSFRRVVHLLLSIRARRLLGIASNAVPRAGVDTATQRSNASQVRRVALPTEVGVGVGTLQCAPVLL